MLKKGNIIKKNTLNLKWGTIKGWHFATKRSKSFKLLEEYMKDAPFSCMADRPDMAKRELICEIIDNFSGVIWNDWEKIIISKNAAKKYIREY